MHQIGDKCLEILGCIVIFGNGLPLLQGVGVIEFLKQNTKSWCRNWMQSSCLNGCRVSSYLVMQLNYFQLLLSPHSISTFSSLASTGFWWVRRIVWERDCPTAEGLPKRGFSKVFTPTLHYVVSRAANFMLWYDDMSWHEVDLIYHC